MSNNHQTTNKTNYNADEVDLGSLFLIIGRGFSNFFNFIGNIFTRIYNLVVVVISHFYKRLYWYAGSIIIGFIIGFAIDSNSTTKYNANLFIETNFNSARQVYENIYQFHQLASIDKDTLELAKRLKISPSEASKLKGFYIEPDINENKLVELYSEFFGSLDSLSRLETTYYNFKESLYDYNFKFHKIAVSSTDKSLFKKIEDTFVDQIANNPYLKGLVEVNKLNLERKDQALLLQIKKTESLVDEYLKIRQKESEKEVVAGNGTSLYMGDSESSGLLVDESKVLENRLVFEAERRQINLDMIEQKTAINILSGFPYSGYNIAEWYEKRKFIAPFFLCALTLLIFTMISLGNYIKRQPNH
jgi:hypothetical protein